MLQCKICNKEFGSYTGLASHINQVHNLLSKDYYIQYLKQKDEGICPVCGKETKWFSLRKGFRKHCSVSCSTADPEVYKLKSETEFKNTGYHSPMEDPKHHQKMIELSKLPENQQKRIESCKSNNGQGTGFQIKTVKEKADNTILIKYNIDNVFKLQDTHKKSKETKRLLYNNENYNNTEKAKETKRLLYNDENYNNREKAKNTYFNKTGYYSPLINPEVKSKQKQKYFYNELSFDSSWELAYYIWLTDKNIKFEYQPNTPFKYYVNGIEKMYFPDFLIEHQYYEIKGNQFFNEAGQLINPFNNTVDTEKYQCMIDNNVIILRSDDIKPILNYIKEKYGCDYLKQFKIEK